VSGPRRSTATDFHAMYKLNNWHVICSGWLTCARSCQFGKPVDRTLALDECDGDLQNFTVGNSVLRGQTDFGSTQGRGVEAV
jgi:hypothetical protein